MRHAAGFIEGRHADIITAMSLWYQRLSSAVLWAAAALACGAPAVLACGTVTADPEDDPAAQGISVTNDDKSDNGEVDISIEPAELRLAPGETQTIQVTVDPAGEQAIQVALLGNPSGAFLSASELLTDSDGRAELELTIAADTESFTLLVTADGNSEEVDVLVSSIARANVLVVPEYAGVRAFTHWNVTLSTGDECDSLPAYNGPTTTSFERTAPAMLVQRRADKPVTLLVSAEEYIFGCRRDVILEPNQENVIAVTMTDRPMQIDQIDWDLGFGIEESSDIRSRFNAVIELMVDAFSPAPSDVDLFLQLLIRRSHDPPAVDSQSRAQQWGTRLRGFLGAEADSVMRDIARAWLLSGTRLLFDSNSFSGHLTHTQNTSGRAIFELASIAGLSPRGAGVPDLYATSLTVEAEDELLTSLEVQALPSRLFVALAGAARARSSLAPVSPPDGATSQTSTAPDDSSNESDSVTSNVVEDVARYFADDIGCRLLAASLTSGSEDPACHLACVEALCQQVIEDMWWSAGNAVLDPASITVLASGPARIDNQAKPLGLSGTWVGETDFDVNGELPIAVQGPFSTSD